MSRKLSPEMIEALERTITRLVDDEGAWIIAVAKELGLPVGLATRLHVEGRRRRAREEQERGDPISLLSPRLALALRRMRLAQPSALRAAIEDGTLKWDGEDLWHRGKRVPHFAVKSWRTLLQWAGLPLPPSEKFLVCPHCGKRIDL